MTNGRTDRRTVGGDNNIYIGDPLRFFLKKSVGITIKVAHNHFLTLVATNSENGLLPLWGSVVVLCFAVRSYVSILVLQSS